jgi:hypothetical protein
MTRILCRLLLAAVAVTATHVASARGSTSFAGLCRFDRGAFTYSDPVGFLPQRVRWTIDESGVCWGRLNGRTVNAAPTAVHEDLEDDIGGCGPTSDAHGPGVLTFAAGGRLHYHVRHGVILGQPFLARGDGGGLATGLAEAFTENKPSALALCASGRYRSGPLRYVLQTLGTLAG